MSEILQFLKQFFTEKQTNKFENQLLYIKHYLLFDAFDIIKSKWIYKRCCFRY